MLLIRAVDNRTVVPVAGVFVTVALYAGLLLAYANHWKPKMTAASLFSSLAGFAFSPLCGAMLFQFRHDAVAVVQIMLVCSLANHSLSVCMLRRDIDWRQLPRFLLPGALGVLSGVFALLHLQVQSYVRVLGCILVLYGSYVLLRPAVVLRRTGIVGDTISCLFGGMLGGLAATPGAPLSIWCAMKGWDKTRQRALYQPFILFMQAVALIAIPAMRPGGALQGGFPSMVYLYVPADRYCDWIFLVPPDDQPSVRNRFELPASCVRRGAAVLSD